MKNPKHGLDLQHFLDLAEASFPHLTAEERLAIAKRHHAEHPGYRTHSRRSKRKLRSLECYRAAVLLLLLFVAFKSAHCQPIPGSQAPISGSSGSGSNATSLQGRAVSSAVPNDTQVLTWNVSQSKWIPADAGTASMVYPAAGIPNSTGTAWGSSYTLLPGTVGGTGVNNGTFTLTLAGNVSFTGAFNPVFAVPASGTWTLPAPGTLVNTSVATLSSLSLPYSQLTGTPSIPVASTTNPLMDGIVSFGTGATWARADHVHPVDTSRQAVITGAPGTWPTTFSPAAHAATHASAGSDPVTLTEGQITNLTTDLSSKSPLASPTFTGTVKLPITGSTQCLHVDSTGAVSGTLSDCSSGGGGANASGFYLVNQALNAPVNAINLGLLSSGLLNVSVSGAIATVGIASAGTDYVTPSVATLGSLSLPYTQLTGTPAIPVASSTNPVMDGTVAVGTGTTWARADHVHPSDTSKASATGFYLVNQTTNAPANAINLGALSTGLLKITVSAGVATVANAAAADIPTFSTTNTVAVTSAASNTSEQNLQAIALPAGALNGTTRQMRVFAGIKHTTGSSASTSTARYRIKLCTVSGCATGTVVTLLDWTSTAMAASATSVGDVLDGVVTVPTSGATGTVEGHGIARVTLVATAGGVETAYGDNITAVSAAIDLTAALFLQTTVLFSANGSGASAVTASQRSLAARIN